MGDHPNVQLVKGLLDAFNAGDEDSITAAFAPDVKWHVIGGETVHGLEALAGMMTGDGPSVTAEVHDVVGNDDHVVALVEATATAGDQVLNYRTAEIMHVEDGKVTERWAFSDDTQRINDFFAQFDDQA